MMITSLLCVLLLQVVTPRAQALAFWSPSSTSLRQSNNQNNGPLYMAKVQNTSPLPKGLSPFEKSVSKSLDIQGNFRKLAGTALEKALQDGLVQVELEFPPLAGGDQSKSQFDDFDNISELNANRDWCVQLVPSLKTPASFNDIWFVLPDDKETELAKEEWTGQRYRGACRFTSIRAALVAALGGDEKGVTLAWGSTFASTVNKLQGGDGILADSSALDELDASQGRLHLVCQPGNGGPVEDWINCQKLHEASQNVPSAMCIVNGALDKVRDNYYPGIFFPALATTKSFYDGFEAAFFLKPISDKGLYGWIYRVYPEPWQVVLQTARQVEKGGRTEVVVEDKVALVSETRPSYQEAVTAMIQTASQ